MFASAVCASLFALTLTVLSVSAASGLSLKVTTPASVAGVDSLTVIITVTNTDSETVKVVNDPNGPLSSFPANTFAITDATGNSPEFIGAKVKWSPEYAVSVDDVTTLAPGQSIEVTHDLKHTYSFTTTGEGVYGVSVHDTPFYIIAPTGEITIIHAKVEASAVKVTGKLALPRGVDSPQKRATFRGCSTERQSLLYTAAIDAQFYAAQASIYLDMHTSTTPRYTTWFGTYIDSRHDTVQSHFSKINNSTFMRYTFDCSCTEYFYAYVYPDDFGVVYLCEAFWSAPATGIDSKAGTLIHESSHFTRNGGTEDYAYGQFSAKGLAIDSPDQAVFNADNHEYFAENTPALQ